MEGFEHLVKVALEAEHLIVSSNLKFPVKMLTRKRGGEEEQTHGYEVDLVGARSDLLVLASVKSYFGSAGVKRQGFRELANCDKPTPRQLRHFDRYKLFNFKEIREGVIAKAAKQFGYSRRQVELRLYAGKFQNEATKNDIKAYLGKVRAGKGGIRTFDLSEILATLLTVLESKTYFNDPVIMTLKALTEGIRQARSQKGQRTNLKKAVDALHEVLGLPNEL
jgi:hypothetical protein